MIVVDASVVIDLITDIGRKTRLHDSLRDRRLLAPDVLPIEVASGLRGLNLGGKLSGKGLDEATRPLHKLPIDLHPSLPLIPRVLTLRKNFSAYDASYIALAATFRCPLLTYDRRLARAAKQHCDIDVAVP